MPFGYTCLACSLFGEALQHINSELGRFGYFVVNLLMIIVGALLLRRVFVIFGSLGAFYYLSYLANYVFRDSWLFPFALTLIGIAVIALGAYWQKHERTISAKVRSYLPQSLQNFLAGNVNRL